jgi:hypothetical protein
MKEMVESIDGTDDARARTMFLRRFARRTSRKARKTFNSRNVRKDARLPPPTLPKVTSTSDVKTTRNAMTFQASEREK